ncbi:hypothetical protein QYF61_024688 [Mycteria americana]|uniref:Uncharacterized protein n=1 Tax=Mycteria americana TaxID=33587 RepID=A0AAN7RST6_MYCAM|nr:hypothetical protein QYF61_024688 [Mycteria americana]
MLLAFLATWAHCWLIFRRLSTNTPRSFSAWQLSKPVALHGVAVAQVQDLALSLIEPHTIGPSPSIQPVQVPLQSLPSLKQIDTPAQFGVLCKLTEGALDPFIQITDKDIKQNWPQRRALGNTACDRPPTGVNSIHHHSLGPAIQPVLNPARSTPVQAMTSQFLQENAVGDSVKGFTKVQVDNICSLSLIHQAELELRDAVLANLADGWSLGTDKSSKGKTASRVWGGKGKGGAGLVTFTFRKQRVEIALDQEKRKAEISSPRLISGASKG